MNRTIYFDLKFAMGSHAITVAITDHFFTDSADVDTIMHSHSHPGFELQYITEGKGFVRSDNQKYRIKKGSYVIMAPNLLHVLQSSTETPLRRVTFLFYISKPLEEKKKNNVDEERKVVDILTGIPDICVIEDGSALYESFQRIGKEIMEKKLGYLEKLKGMFESLLIDVARDVTDLPVLDRIPLPADMDENRAQFIEDYFNANYNKSCRRRDLAAMLYLSEKQLERILKRLYQKSFRELLLESRMSMSDYFLAEGKMSMNEIAICLGYSSVNAFGYAYKKHYGTTAGVKRKLLGDNNTPE